MKKKTLGTALVLSGPSGSGKSTLIKKLLADYPDVEFSVSCTTRAPRPGEIDGKDYYFLTRERFLELLGEDRFVEHAEVHGNFYGTLKSEVTERVEKCRDVLLDIDVQGAMSVKKLCESNATFRKACEFVFISPPSIAELERRLRSRATDAEDVILRRVRNAAGEMAFLPEYSYFVVNDDLETAYTELKSLYIAFGLSTGRAEVL